MQLPRFNCPAGTDEAVLVNVVTPYAVGHVLIGAGVGVTAVDASSPRVDDDGSGDKHLDNSLSQ